MKNIILGTSQKDDALKLLPEKTVCKSIYIQGFSRYVVELPNGVRIANARSSLRAWNKAKEWALKSENQGYLRNLNIKKDNGKPQ